MGYDMRWRRRDEAEVFNVKIAREALERACDERDIIPVDERGTYVADMATQHGIDDPRAWKGRSSRYAAAEHRVQQLMNTIYDTEVSYFRLNIWGMGTWREIMLLSEMVFEDEPHPPWPEYEDFGITSKHYYAIKYSEDYPDIVITDDIRQGVERYTVAHDRVLSFHGKADTPGIPLTKFGSNDGWIVLPIECEAAVRIWHAFAENHGVSVIDQLFAASHITNDRWNEWLRFLTGAAKHDGFEVW